MLKQTVVILSLFLAVTVTIVSGVLHYKKLAAIPYGFHVDELCGSVAVGCLATEGIDAHRVRYPVFADMHYGTPKPPNFIYPAVLWSKFFGFSAPSLRGLCVTVHLLGIVGLFALARLFFGWRYALITTMLAAVSPWTWVLSRVAFESLFSVTFLVWGLYFYFKSHKCFSWALAGLFFAGAMYSYPPTRLHVPVMLLVLFVYSCCKGKFKLSSAAALLISLGVVALPLIHRLRTGELLGRFNTISITSREYLQSIGKTASFKDLAEIFRNNFLQHLKPDFLIFHGDPSMVHSTHHFGILSWLDMAALGVFVVLLIGLCFKRFRPRHPLIVEWLFLVFLVVNIVTGVLPVALTNSELPNSLRIVGAWPFVCLFSGYLLWQACERFWGLWPVVVLAGALFFGAFSKVYFEKYPQESRGMFNYWTLEEANAIKNDQDWLKFMLRYRYQDYHARYFLMQYKEVGCSDSKAMWDNLRDLLIRRNEY